MLTAETMQAPHDQFDRDAKLDGLGVALFAVVSAMLEEMADTHPVGMEVQRRVRSAAIDMATSVTDHVGGIGGAAIRVQALGAIASVFAGTRIGLSASGGNVGDKGGPRAG